MSTFSPVHLLRLTTTELCCKLISSHPACWRVTDVYARARVEELTYPSPNSYSRGCRLTRCTLPSRPPSWRRWRGDGPKSTRVSRRGKSFRKTEIWDRINGFSSIYRDSNEAWAIFQPIKAHFICLTLVRCFSIRAGQHMVIKVLLWYKTMYCLWFWTSLYFDMVTGFKGSTTVKWFNFMNVKDWPHYWGLFLKYLIVLKKSPGHPQNIVTMLSLWSKALRCFILSPLYKHLCLSPAWIQFQRSVGHLSISEKASGTPHINCPDYLLLAGWLPRSRRWCVHPCLRTRFPWNFFHEKRREPRIDLINFWRRSWWGDDSRNFTDIVRFFQRNILGKCALILMNFFLGVYKWVQHDVDANKNPYLAG